MASTNEVLLAGLVGVGATAFAQANQPYVEPTTMTAPQPAAATCTIRLNRFYRDDNAPLDERYIGTKNEDLVKRTGPYADRLFPSASLSGITYSQPGPVENQKAIFWPPKQTLSPTELEVTFLDKNSQVGRYLPSGKHDTFYTPTNGYGLLVDSPHINWSESFEVKINDPEKCLVTRKALVEAPPDYSSTGIMTFFSSIASYDSDSYARTVWESVTGKPNDPAKLKADPDVRVIDRDVRLKEDRASGQLKQPSDYSDIPPPYAATP